MNSLFCFSRVIAFSRRPTSGISRSSVIMTTSTSSIPRHRDQAHCHKASVMRVIGLTLQEDAIGARPSFRGCSTEQ